MFHNVTYYALQFCKRLALSQFEAKIVIAEPQGVRWRARAGACRVHPPLRHARELAMSQRFCEKKVHTPTCDSIRHIMGEK